MERMRPLALSLSGSIAVMPSVVAQGTLESGESPPPGIEISRAVQEAPYARAMEDLPQNATATSPPTEARRTPLRGFGVACRTTTHVQ